MIKIIKALGLLNWYYEQNINYYYKKQDSNVNVATNNNIGANANITSKSSKNDYLNLTNKTNNHFSDNQAIYLGNYYIKNHTSKAAKVARDLADKSTNLKELRHAVMNFDECDLKKGATQVF